MTSQSSTTATSTTPPVIFSPELIFNDHDDISVSMANFKVKYIRSAMYAGGDYPNGTQHLLLREAWSKFHPETPWPIHFDPIYPEIPVEPTYFASIKMPSVTPTNPAELEQYIIDTNANSQIDLENDMLRIEYEAAVVTATAARSSQALSRLALPPMPQRHEKMTAQQNNVILDARAEWEYNKKIVDGYRTALLDTRFFPLAFRQLLDSQDRPAEAMLPAQIVHTILTAGDIGKGSDNAVTALQDKLASGAEIFDAIEAAAWFASVARTIKQFPTHDPCSEAAAFRATRAFSESHPVLAALLTHFELHVVPTPELRTWAAWTTFAQAHYANYAKVLKFTDRSQAKVAHANAVAAIAKGSANAASTNTAKPVDKSSAWCFVCDREHDPMRCVTAKDIVKLVPGLAQLQTARYKNRPVTIKVKGEYEGKKYEQGCGKTVLKQLKFGKPAAKANAAASAAGGGGAAAESDED